VHRTRAETHGNATLKFKEKHQRSCGKGKLIGKLIDELALYYGLAIRRNPNSVENMKNRNIGDVLS